MFKYKYDTTHNFLFYMLEFTGEFCKLPNSIAFEEDLDKLIEEFNEEMIRFEDSRNQKEYDPINGSWCKESNTWVNGWFEGNLDKKKNRSEEFHYYHFPDVTGSAQDITEGDATLCPRDLFNHHKISLTDKRLIIEYLFIHYESDVKTLSKRILQLISCHISGKEYFSKSQRSDELFSNLIIQLSSSSMDPKDLVERARLIVKEVNSSEFK